MSDKIVVAYVCDEHYKQFLKISMDSIKRYNKNVEFVILSSQHFDVPGAQVYTFQPDTNSFKFKRNDRMHEGVYYKFWLPILPYKKILYIDCDVLCQRPLDELWNIDCPFICATESHNFGLIQAKQLGVKRYALSGMMLMNLDELRKSDFTNKCLSRLDKESKVKWHDETIINLVFNNKIKFIDKKYNYCKNRIYAEPIDESDAYLLHYVGKDQKKEMLALGEFPTLEELKVKLKGKKVAIVGNSETILNKNQGKDIDDHDVVIRFNKGFPSRNRSALGYKTTLLFLACTLTNSELKDFDAKYTIRRSKLCKNECDFNCQPIDRTRLAQRANSYMKKHCISKLSQPSTGFIAINFALCCDCESIDLYGFDFFKTSTYYNPAGYQTLHNGDKEAEKVLEYQKYGLLSIK